MIESIDVFLWNNKIGTLISTQQNYRQQVCFYFDSDYAGRGLDIAPLRAPISSPYARRGLPVYAEKDKEFGGLPSFIADSMPDKWGNLVFSEWAKAHHIRPKDLSPLDRLAYIGRRGMGALEFVPPTSSEMESPFKVEISELSRLAQLSLKEAKRFHAMMSPDFIIESLFKVGTSAGGRRPKAVINVNPTNDECYSGQVPTPLPGFVPMIIKFDEHSDIPTTRIEYSYYLMAAAAGLNMMPSRLLEGQHETHFLTERFDRKGNEKIHVQTLAAMDPQSNSYEDLFDTAIRIGIPPGELKQLFLQMAMNIAGGNVDDHNKNFSFMMDKDAIWHVSPAYDYTFTIDPSGPYYANRHSMSVNGKTQDITIKDLLEIAEKYNIKEASATINKAIKTICNYRHFATQAGLPEVWINKIIEQLEERVENLQA